VSDEDGDVIIIAVSFFVRGTLYCSSGRDTECCEMCVQGMIRKVPQLYLRYHCKGNVFFSPYFLMLLEKYGFNTQHVMCLTKTYRIPDLQVILPW